MAEPLLSLKGVWREYPAGDQTIAALREVDLTIEAGESVAIIGQSGSGKSTLMNILGCLDRPTKGKYRIAGRDTSQLEPDELAALRREHFGFIFQRYHLLADLDALANVEVPAVYAGWSGARRRERAAALLTRLGLSDRMHNRPNQLSGGQQQRVSVARALMNGGEIILADEPTGALDRRSGEEMLRILAELNAEGHTVIIVTHDPKVAATANRVIEISDGEVISDTRREDAPLSTAKPMAPLQVAESWTAWIDRLGQGLGMALLAMRAHKLRTFLTMLGIIIGIASVVSIMAVGAGAKAQILGQIASIGTNTLNIQPGRGQGDERSGQSKGFDAADMQALEALPYIEGVTPQISSGGSIRYRNISANGQISGVSEQYFQVNNLTLASGQLFDIDAVRRAAQEVVIDDGAKKALFPNGENPLGQVILVGAVPARVIGVTAPATGLFAGFDSSVRIYAPYTMVVQRITRQAEFRSLTLRVADGVEAAVAQEAVQRAMETRRGKADFFIQSSESIRQTISQVTGTLSLLMGAIGGISLLVGGIGVMNIMLVSVSERTREIGVRSAIGARRSDIMSQFIIEAVLVCLIGGALGLGLSMGIAWVVHLAVKNFELIYSTGSILAAFGTATAVGLIFGWLPARNASRLDPIEALARE